MLQTQGGTDLQQMEPQRGPAASRREQRRGVPEVQEWREESMTASSGTSSYLLSSLCNSRGISPGIITANCTFFLPGLRVIKEEAESNAEFRLCTCRQDFLAGKRPSSLLWHRLGPSVSAGLQGDASE